MATVVIGDTHIKAREILPRVDAFIVHAPSIDRVVFCGDYCDDWHASSDEFKKDISYLAEWVETKRKPGKFAVDMVFGNHDFQYLLRRPGPGTKECLYDFVNSILFPLGLCMAHTVDGFLVTHAGLTRSWAKRFLDGAEDGSLDAESAAAQLNAMLDSGDGRTWDCLDMAGFAVGGLDIPSPLWARIGELLSDQAPNISQIVGHTPVERAYKAGNKKTGKDKQIWFCDTFSTYQNGIPFGDGSVLVVDDGVVEVEDLPLSCL